MDRIGDIGVLSKLFSIYLYLQPQSFLMQNSAKQTTMGSDIAENRCKADFSHVGFDVPHSS